MVGPRQFLLGGVALFALTGIAAAADMPIRSPQPQPVFTKATPAWSWEGQYIGVHGGYMWGENNVANGALTDSIKNNGGYFGFQFGYLHHLSRNWVIGYEVDLSFADAAANSGVALNFAFDPKYFGTARTRLGYANGPWLFYGTGGLAAAHTEATAGALEFKMPLVGYAVGAGIEYALTPNTTARVEYLFADFGRASLGTLQTDLTMSTIRFALNYRFANWNAAPAIDMPVKAPVRVSGWTGPYIGVHGSYTSGEFTEINGVVAPVTLDPSGGMFGITSGYNWQLSRNWVIGVEGDSSWGSIDDAAGANSIDIDAMGTVRARLGYANGNILTYTTGGLAWIHSESNVGIIARDRFYLGWAAGAGVEWALSPRWSAKLEYLYSKFDSTDISGIGVLDDDIKLHTFKIGLNYRAGILDLIGMRW